MSKPHLTPGELFPDSDIPGPWKDTRVAFVCFTPFPRGFEPYVVKASDRRLFLHSPESEVRLCMHRDIPFLVVSEVYGFAVGTTTMEELHHYGVDTVIGVGFVGAFCDARTGDKFIAGSVMSDLPLASHYGIGAFESIGPTPELDDFLTHLFERETPDYRRLAVWNSNSLYREYDETVSSMKSRGCQVVNMDTLSVFSAGARCRDESDLPFSYAYVGTVTDSEGGEDGDEAWESDLMDTIGGSRSGSHDELVKILVECLMPDWMRRK